VLDMHDERVPVLDVHDERVTVLDVHDEGGRAAAGRDTGRVTVLDVHVLVGGW
jgi:hypothetical protein